MCGKDCICKKCPSLHICIRCNRCDTPIKTCSTYDRLLQYNCNYCGTITTEKMCPTCKHTKEE